MNVSRVNASPLLRIARFLCFAGLSLFSGAQLLGSDTSEPALYRVDSTHSSVEFSITKWVVTRQYGSFRELDGTIRMAAECPEATEVEIRIHAASLDTRNSGRDRVVRSDDFLDVENHPHLIFRSKEIRRNSSGSFDVVGNLTIRGVTRRIVAPVRFLGATEVAGLGELISFETQFVVNRRDFGVLGTRWSGGKTILGDEVDVRLTVAARKVD
ncbi:MAG: YceI family protein [Acidobacteria bacterium]|nr:YceI family protein [Acidobacteriota bacterium]